MIDPAGHGHITGQALRRGRERTVRRQWQQTALHPQLVDARQQRGGQIGLSAHRLRQRDQTGDQAGQPNEAREPGPKWRAPRHGWTHARSARRSFTKTHGASHIAHNSMIA